MSPETNVAEKLIVNGWRNGKFQRRRASGTIRLSHTYFFFTIYIRVKWFAS